MASQKKNILCISRLPFQPVLIFITSPANTWQTVNPDVYLQKDHGPPYKQCFNPQVEG